MALFLSLLLGIASGFGFAPWGLWPLTIGAVAAWLTLVHAAPTRRAALLGGWLFGIGQFSVTNAWIQHAFTFQDAMPPALGFVAVALLAGYLALYPMLAGGLAWRFRKPALDAGFVLLAGAGWAVTEWLRGSLFTGYPWSPLGVIWVGTPLARIAAFTGTYALSGLTIVLAGALALLARRVWRFPVAVAIATGLLVLLAQRPNPAPPPGTPHVRVVQPNLPEQVRPGPNYAENNLDALIRQTGTPGAVPRLIVWPEGALRLPIEDGYPPDLYAELGHAGVTRARLAALLGPGDVLLTGGQGFVFDSTEAMAGATNSIFALGPDAALHGRYDKAHLVPWGEYLPARNILTPLGLSRLVPGDFDFIAGPGPRSLAVPGFGLIGMDICYEIIFSGHVVDASHRPRLIFNPSDDAWFGTMGPPAHLAQARLRAIEEGLPIVRATPTGISAIIDADGGLVAALPLARAGAIEAPIPLAHSPTLFARIGNWMVLLVALALAGLAIAIRRVRRSPIARTLRAR